MGDGKEAELKKMEEPPAGRRGAALRAKGRQRASSDYFLRAERLRPEGNGGVSGWIGKICGDKGIMLVK
jgi:hypothetical protein